MGKGAIYNGVIKGFSFKVNSLHHLLSYLTSVCDFQRGVLKVNGVQGHPKKNALLKNSAKSSPWCLNKSPLLCFTFNPLSNPFLGPQIPHTRVQFRTLSKLPFMTLEMKFLNSNEMNTESRQKVDLMTWGSELS